MFGPRWKVLRLFGIPVYIDASWLIVLALLALSFAAGFPALLNEYFPGMLHSLPIYESWLLGLATALGIFVCILLHELGHALVARSQGMAVRDINLFLLGGVAEIREEPHSPGNEVTMALAGPAVSVVLATLLWLLASMGFSAGWPHPLVVVLGYLAFINVLVLAFNLLPAFPLDGGRVLHSILWSITGNLKKSTYWSSLVGQGFAWFLVGWGIWLFFVGNWLNGIWIFVIGLFLNSAAQTGYRQLLVRQALAGQPVQRFMNSQPIVVSPSLDLEHWIDDYVYRYHHHAFPVASNSHLEGVITTQSMERFPRDQWRTHLVEEAMQREVETITISPQTDALAAMEKMQQSGSSRLLVIEEGNLVGLLTLKDLLKFLGLRLELEQG